MALTYVTTFTNFWLLIFFNGKIYLPYLLTYLLTGFPLAEKRFGNIKVMQNICSTSPGTYT